MWRDGAHYLEGEVTITEIGDQLSATFHFDNGSEGDRHTRVDARLYRIPLMPQG